MISEKKFRDYSLERETSLLFKPFAERFAEVSDGIKLNKFNSFRVPKGFDFSRLLEKYPLKFVVNVPAFLSYLRISRNFLLYKIKKDGSNPFISIHAPFLRSRLTTVTVEYKQFLKMLVDEGLIEIDESWAVRVKCKGYRLTDALAERDWEIVDYKEFILKTFPDLRRTPKWAALYLNQWNRILCSMGGWRGMEKGPVRDVCEWQEQIGKELTVPHDQKLDDEMEQVAKEAWQDYQNEKKKDPKFTYGRMFEIFYNSIEAIREKHFTVSAHDKRKANWTNRVFSNITNLKSEFRKYLRLDGEQLYSIDIACSQASLLVSFYDPAVPEHMEEKRKFVDIIRNDDLYSNLAAVGGIARKQAKVEAFKIFFGQNFIQKGPLCEAFKKEFPLLTKEIAKRKFRNYKNCARLLQQMESHIVIEKTAYELTQKKIKFLTIHDSICVKKEDIPIARECLERHFEETLGFPPKLTVELA